VSDTAPALLLEGVERAHAAGNARFVLEIDYGFDPRVWLIGLFGGALLVAVSGWIATRSVVRQPPIATLRAN